MCVVGLAPRAAAKSQLRGSPESHFKERSGVRLAYVRCKSARCKSGVTFPLILQKQGSESNFLLVGCVWRALAWAADFLEADASPELLFDYSAEAVRAMKSLVRVDFRGGDVEVVILDRCSRLLAPPTPVIGFAGQNGVRFTYGRSWGRAVGDGLAGCRQNGGSWPRPLRGSRLGPTPAAVEGRRGFPAGLRRQVLRTASGGRRLRVLPAWMRARCRPGGAGAADPCGGRSGRVRLTRHRQPDRPSCVPEPD